MATGRLVASRVLAKHDENYMPKEVYDELRKNAEEGAVRERARHLIAELGHLLAFLALATAAAQSALGLTTGGEATRRLAVATGMFTAAGDAGAGHQLRAAGFLGGAGRRSIRTR